MAHASPVPAQTIDGFDGATASAPIACTRMLSETGRKVAPLSTDFHTPPDAAPRYQIRGSPGTPVMAAIRPPSAGPIDWKRNGSGIGGGRRWPGRVVSAGVERVVRCAVVECIAIASDATARSEGRIKGYLQRRFRGSSRRR